jgi:DNA-binding transcriptional LysR family regulator
MPWDDRVKRHLKLRDLDILMTVQQAGGIGKAAAHLHMSQPAVSKAIADLEQALGVRLLERSRRGAEPTPFGLALIKRGFSVFDELRGGVQDIDFLSDPTAGELRIGATEPIAAAIVSPVIDQLARQYPRANFHVVPGDPMYRELAEKKIELAIARVTEPPDEGQSAEVLFHDSLVIVSGKSNPLVRRRKIQLAELMNQPWIQQPFDSVFGSIVAQSFRAAGFAPPRLMIATMSYILRIELLATGRYLSVVPGLFVKLPRRHETLRVLAVEVPNATHPVVVITLKGRSLSPLAQLFLDRVRAMVRPLAKEGRSQKHPA